MEKTTCELFAGVGGFRLALEKSGFRTLWFSQWEPGKKKQWAHECYVKHFGEIREDTCSDISLVDKGNIPDHTLLTAGFPCQDYSVANSASNAKGIEGKKGVLWWQIYNTIAAKTPKFILLENVDRLLKSPKQQAGRDFGIILSCLDSLGYIVEWMVVNSAMYGSAQRRKRTFIFASHKSTSYSVTTMAKEKEEILCSSGFFSGIFSFEKKKNSKIDTVSFVGSNVISISNNFTHRFGNHGIMINGIIHDVDIEYVPDDNLKTLDDILEENVDEKYFIGEDKIEKWKNAKGAKKIERTAKNGHKYVFSEGAVPFPDDTSTQSRTILTSEGSISRTSHIIKDKTNGRYRRLTPVEAERLQGFPDNWTDTGMSERMRYFCMGNALVVGIVERIGRKISRIIEEETSE